MIKVNGEKLDEKEILLTEVLSRLGYTGRIAVEVNEDIVPRAEHEGFVLHDGDTVEIVTLVGGG